jgi:predicted lipoprotein with Yx(FWY)xxD motif
VVISAWLATAPTFAARTDPHQTNKPVTVTLARRGPLGRILVDGSGNTLYRLNKDRANKSTCANDCAVAWPPFVLPKGVDHAVAGSGVSQLGTVRRANGQLQVTYRGWPLYYFSGDGQAGAVNGEGISDLWFVLTTATSAAPGYREARRAV